ncbi:MAG TPA: HAD-IIB family hydrolase [Steroidobacter sp.]|nr:HAD-IIB family hydrolase [Steroidobacter sp.]
MRYVALAAGYEGTLARNGRCDARCIDSLHSVAASGRKLILVAGRVLRELLETFPEARLFDYIVAENGAVMYRPATRESAILAQAPPEILLHELQRRAVAPLSVGSSSINTSDSNRSLVADALQKLGLDFQILSNEGVMSVLPPGVDKAYGVQAALKELGLSQHNLVAIGDGENDIALFELAEHAAAVRDADPALKRVADQTTRGECSEGFLELTKDLIATDLAAAPPRKRIFLGRCDDGREIWIAPGRDSLIVCGPAGASQSAVCERLLQELLALEYQCCIVEDETGGDRTVRSGVAAFGEAHDAPRLTDAMNALEQPAMSVAMNVAALPAEMRPMFTEALLVHLQALHDRVGRPHCILLKQAHRLLAGESAASTARLAEVTMVYATAEPQRLPTHILRGVKLIVAPGGPIRAALAPGDFRETAHATIAGGESLPISVLRADSSRPDPPSSDARSRFSGY